MSKIPKMVFDRPIAYHRCFVSLGIGVTGAVFLSQACFWSHKTKDPSGWFYKTIVEWENETGLTRHEQSRVKKLLTAMSILDVKKAGIPPKNFFKVNFDILSSNPAFQDAEIRSNVDPNSGPSLSRNSEDPIYDSIDYTKTTSKIPLRLAPSDDIFSYEFFAILDDGEDVYELSEITDEPMVKNVSGQPAEVSKHTSEENKKINEVIHLFDKVFPGDFAAIKKMATRDAVYNLLQSKSVAQIKSLVEKWVASATDPFRPSVGTVYEFCTFKLAKIEAYLSKEKKGQLWAHRSISTPEQSAVRDEQYRKVVDKIRDRQRRNREKAIAEEKKRLECEKNGTPYTPPTYKLN